MFDSRPTELGVLIAGGASVAALASGPGTPDASTAVLVGAATLTLILLACGAPARSPVRLGRAPGPREPSRVPEFTRFLASMDDGVPPGAPARRSRNGRGRSRGEDDQGEDERGSGSLSYEEFTAGLEEGEEISFLPPYASDDAEPADHGGSGHDVWDPLADASHLEPDESTTRSKMPVPRHFALGTVAIIRRLLEPSEVERILGEQRRYPRLRFGDVAVQLGLLTDGQIQELLLAQQEGLFTNAEIREARERLRAYRLNTPTAR